MALGFKKENKESVIDGVIRRAENCAMAWKKGTVGTFWWAKSKSGGLWMVTFISENGHAEWRVQKRNNYSGAPAWLDFGRYTSYREARDAAETIQGKHDEARRHAVFA